MPSYQVAASTYAMQSFSQGPTGLTLLAAGNGTGFGTYGVREEPTIQAQRAFIQPEDADEPVQPKWFIVIVAGIFVDIVNAAEVDTAKALGATKLLASLKATEVDTAKALGATKLLASLKATEVDTARAQAIVKLVAIAKATGVNTAKNLSILKLVNMIHTTEVDSARPTSITHVIIVVPAHSTELDTAQALSITAGAPMVPVVYERPQVPLSPEIGFLGLASRELKR